MSLTRVSVFDRPGVSPVRFVERSVARGCGPSLDFVAGDRPRGESAYVLHRADVTVQGARPCEVYEVTILEEGLSISIVRGGSSASGRARFDFSGSETSVGVVVVEPDGSRASANVYLGNAIDVSHFVNGFMPTEVVDLAEIGAQDVWLHHCFLGGEAYALLRADASTRARREEDLWREVLVDVSYACRRWRDSLDDVAPVRSQVDVIRGGPLVDRLGAVSRELSDFVDRLHETELLRVARWIEDLARARSHEIHEEAERDRRSFWATHPEFAAGRGSTWSELSRAVG